MPKNAFIAHLCSLAERDDRAALAHLRRGLGKPPGTDPLAFPYVAPWLSGEMGRREQDRFFLTASLFATHPNHRDGFGSIGATLKRVAKEAQSDESVERRFVALLNAHEDDLPKHLRHAVSIARTFGVPIDYEMLLKHLRSWRADTRWVQRRWAQDFWGYSREEETSEANNDQASEKEN